MKQHVGSSAGEPLFKHSERKDMIMMFSVSQKARLGHVELSHQDCLTSDVQTATESCI